MKFGHHIMKPGKIFLFMALCFVPAIISSHASSISYEYDASGRLTGVSYDQSVNISYQYDAMGNLVSKMITDIPSSPTLSVSVSDGIINLSWTEVSGSTGYYLSYVPFPYTGSIAIGTIDMGQLTEMSFELWSGAAFYVAVGAYNDLGKSEFSNIELVELK